MNNETIEYSRKDLEKRIEQYIIRESLAFATLYPKYVDKVVVDMRFSGMDVANSQVTVSVDAKR